MKLITQRRKYGSQGQRFAVCCLLLCAFLLNGFSVVAQEHNTETNTISNVANDFKDLKSSTNELLGVVESSQAKDAYAERLR